MCETVELEVPDRSEFDVNSLTQNTCGDRAPFRWATRSTLEIRTIWE